MTDDTKNSETNADATTAAEPSSESNSSPASAVAATPDVTNAANGDDNASPVEVQASPADEQSASTSTSDDDAPAPKSEDVSAAGATDTGRRIDPAKLSGAGGGPTRLRHGGRGGKSQSSESEDSTTSKGASNHSAGAAAPRDARAQGDAKDGGEKKRQRRPRRKDKEGGDKRNSGEQNKGERGQGPDGVPPRPREPAQLNKVPAAAKEQLVEFDYTGDFAAMLDEAGPIRADNFSTGDEVQATLISVGSESAFFDIGGNQEAYCSRADVQDDDGNPTVEVGDTVRMFVIDTRGGIQISKRLSRHGVDVTMLDAARENGIPVEGKVVGHNKGGLEIEIAGTRGFCPMGQADVNYVEDPATFLGQTLSFLIKEVKEGGKNVLVSRRALLQREKDVEKEKTLETLQIGSRITGTVTRVQPFGAFVDLGGIDGMIPVSELSWGRVEDPSSVVSPGDLIEVEVTRMEPDPKRKGELRIGLSRKTILGDPWDDNAHNLQPGKTLEGKVTRIADFGAFVALFDGIEGLIHISELSHERVHRVDDVVKAGAPVTVRILSVDEDARRVGLSLKESRPEPEAGDAPSRGARVNGTVERIERYGVFLALETGVTALLPASESGTPHGTDLNRAFPLGTKIDVSVIDVDERGRVKVSKIARERADEREVLETYKKSDSAGGSMGTFGDLFAKLRP